MPPKTVFISYSKNNASELVELETALSSLKREGKITTWTDQAIMGGAEWDAAIKNKLQEADIILLLVSSSFLATDYIWNVELKDAMVRHERKEAVIIPIILRPCDWLNAPFAKLNALPSKGTPVSTFTDRDAAWLEVVGAIRKIVEPQTSISVSPQTQNPVNQTNNMEQIKQLIGKARLKEALELLEQNVSEHLKNDVLQLKARLTKLERDNMLGIIGTTEEGIERAKITNAALGLCEELGSSPSVSIQHNNSTPPSYKLGNIRKFLAERLTEEEFDALCMDNFDEVHNQFSAGQNKTQKINLLLDYCKRKLKMEDLLNAMKDINPTLFGDIDNYKS